MEDVIDDSNLRKRLSESEGTRADPTMAVTNLNRSVTAAQPTEESMSELMSETTVSETQNTCCTIFFNLNTIQGTTEILNDHIQDLHNDFYVRISRSVTLTAVLWKGLSRARIQAVDYHSEVTSTVVLPVNVRNKMDPPLDESYFGNAFVPGYSTLPILTLGLPLDAATLAYTARTIINAVARVSENHVQSIIAGINESTDVQANPLERVARDNDLTIRSWTDLHLTDGDMGLGIGQPAWGRKIGRSNDASGCTVHPVRQSEGLWEVTVELPKHVMDALVDDEGFTKFVAFYA